MTEDADVTSVSDKGQVVIPVYLRNKLGLRPRSKLLVYGVKDAIVMKKLELPDMKEEMQSLWKEIDRNIEKYGSMSDQDIKKEIESCRTSKKEKRSKGNWNVHRVVLDTNALISALITHGKPRELWNYILEDKLILVTSKELLEEFEEVISRQQFRKYISRRSLMKFRRILYRKA